MEVVIEDLDRIGSVASPVDVTELLRVHGWNRVASLGNIAQRWQSGSARVVVPMLTSSPDFKLRWTEMLDSLAQHLETDPAGVLLAVVKTGSDIAEFRASGQIDDSLPLGDANTLLDSVRRAMQASANSALQRRSYFGHSIPAAAREHANNVRMGQTRRGSYIVPIISRLPVLEPDDADDAVLFEHDAAYQPLARSAMLRLAEGLTTLQKLTHGSVAPKKGEITEAVGAGVSSELCEAVAKTLETEAISDLGVTFSWAQRLPTSSAPQRTRIESEAAPLIREVESYLRGEPLVGRQTVIGYVKGLDRGEEEQFGRITLRVLDNDRARNVTMELNEDYYQVAGEANTDRRMVAATGVLYREPGRMLRMKQVADFHRLGSLVEQENERRRE